MRLSLLSLLLSTFPLLLVWSRPSPSIFGPSSHPPLVPSIRPLDAAAPTNCTIGVDLATPVSKSAFECIIAERGVQYLTVRAFQSNCYLDPHTVDTIHAAWAAGIQNVDIYFFPSYGCTMDGIMQFDLTMQHLASHNASFNRIFFDVEDWEWEPESGCQKNVDWFTPLYQHAIDVLGSPRVGIYTTTSTWSRITCNSKAFIGSMLWYARWDKNPSFDGFLPFGSWDQPFEKQFTGNDGACDIHLDFDYRGSGVC